MAIIDSSTYVKYFAKEPGWDSTAEYFSQPASIELALAEVANALSKKVSLGEMQADDADLFLRRMIEITRFLGKSDSVTTALEMSVEKRVSVYDALFIVAALELRTGLVTSDAKQARVAQEFGVSVDLV